MSHYQITKKVLFLFLLFSPTLASAEKHIPTFDEYFSLENVRTTKISPNGKKVIYTKRANDFENNQYLTQMWLYDAADNEHRQLTYGKKSASGITWSADSQWVFFKRDKKLLVMRVDGGEAKAIVLKQKGVLDYQLSDDLKTIVYTAEDDRKKLMKARKDNYGDFEVVREEAANTQLFSATLKDDFSIDGDEKKLTEQKDLSIWEFSINKDASKVLVTAGPSPRLVDLFKIEVYEIDVVSKALKQLTSTYGIESNAHYSPNEQRIVFNRSVGFQKNNQIFISSLDGKSEKLLSGGFDEDANIAQWNKKGIYFSAKQKTRQHLFIINPKSGKVNRVSSPESLIGSNFSIDKSGKNIAYIASDKTSLNELYTMRNGRIKKRTNQTEQIKDFYIADRQLIQWKAEDGSEIEGVLTKPHDFDSSKQYPLYVVTHGGPTGTDKPSLSWLGAWYPLDIWANKGALILQTNYRGSAGYGEAFRSLNWRDLGLGPAKDIIAGIKHLDKLGMIDTSKVGCLGWSQGGHISAMLATYSDVCSAANMGAGISNWETYYYNTDITQFTVEYFGKTPYEDKQIYQKTSPISYLNNAKTPVLIQHGENDNRVPVANAYELRQGLVDKGVDTSFLLYKKMGHGPRKPKTLRAVLTHTTEWFEYYLMGAEKPDFANPKFPDTEKDDKDEDEDEQSED